MQIETKVLTYTTTFMLEGAAEASPAPASATKDPPTAAGREGEHPAAPGRHAGQPAHRRPPPRPLRAAGAGPQERGGPDALSSGRQIWPSGPRGAAPTGGQGHRPDIPAHSQGRRLLAQI
jgi:hypothetical protein